MTSKFLKFKSLAVLMFLLSSAFLLLKASVPGIAAIENEFILELKSKYKTFFEKTPSEKVYLQFDKTLYKPGETIWFSAYLRADDLKASSRSDILNVELINPKGNVETIYKIVTKDGVGQGDFEIDMNQPGGLYKIKAYTEWQKNDKDPWFFEKEITVQKVVLPRLKMKLNFERKAFGPGDKVIAKLEVNTNDNQPLKNREFIFTGNLDGGEFVKKSAITGSNGISYISFQLPEDISTIDGLLNVLIDFEGITESIARSIPIVLNNIDLQFFPEGGYALNGYESRYGFRAMNEFGKPADVSGIVLDERGNKVTELESYHQGMGAFSFTPQTGKSYHVKITKPEINDRDYLIPEPLKTGYLLRTKSSEEKILVDFVTPIEEQISIIATSRGRIFYGNAVNATLGWNSATINTTDFPMGITQVTLFDSKGIARSERLVFVNKHKQLDINITSKKDKYLPREKVQLEVEVKDERGLPMPGNFSMAVVDDNLLSYADDKSGDILSSLLLEPDIKGTVEEPSFYFDPDEEKADVALDYLLMTAGWRRYSWKQIQEQAFPKIQFQGEKAILEGTIMDFRTKKPVKNATVFIKGQDIQMQTDQEGRFSLAHIDLSSPASIEIRAKGFENAEHEIYAYNSNLLYYMYDESYARETKMIRRKFEGAIPMMAMDAAVKFEMADDDMQIKEVFVDGMAVEIDPHKDNPDLQVGQEPPDMLEGIDIMIDDLEEADVMDKRGNMAAAWDEEIRNRDFDRPVYYRAKEFPIPDYAIVKTQDSRIDFRSTIYWNGLIETDNSGRAKVEFYASDAITSFRATMEGIGDDGTPGRGQQVFYTQLPFSLATKLPVQVISGDELSIPVILRNNTANSLSGDLSVRVPEQLVAATTYNSKVSIAPGQSKTLFLDYNVIGAAKNKFLEVKFQSGTLSDAIKSDLEIISQGFPATLSFSGKDMEKEYLVDITNMIDGSLNATFTAYPSVMSELLSGIESILREPYGCFEQTSSSNYPNLMVLRYLKATEQENAELEAKALNLLDKGYSRLTAYETSEKGYEWFGAAPGHEALTAYGLVQFEDMKTVYENVDQGMIDRTVKWILDKRDGKGGFKKNPKALDSFGRADEDITNAYIVYSLTEAGHKDIKQELEAAYGKAKLSKDPYQLALISNSMFNTGDEKRGDELLQIVYSLQADNGSWTGTKHSITRSSGISLSVETSSLVVLAILKSRQPNLKAMNKGVEFIVNSRTGYGGFGSTQATVLALKALTEFSVYSKQTDEDGTIEIFVDGKKVRTHKYKAGETDPIVVDGLEEYLTKGLSKVKIKFKDAKNPLPYTLLVQWNTFLPQTSMDCAVTLKTDIQNTKLKVGETIRLTITISNVKKEGLPMTMAIVGLPSGCTAQPWQLKELQEKGTIDFYETAGNDIIFYYREMKPSEVKTIHLDLKAEIPGEFKPPASSAYLYYGNEHKYWTSTADITISK